MLLVRKAGDNPFWEVPGGRIDGSETFVETLDRELHEELPNIESYSEPKLLDVSRLPHDIKPDLGLCLIYFRTTAEFKGGEPMISSEHTDYRWATTADAIELVEPSLQAVLRQV